MRAGRLKSTITITRPMPGILDAGGADVPTWAPVTTLRAEIIQNDAKTFLAEAGETTETAIIFRVRFRDGIEPGQRVTLEGQHYTLAEIKEVLRRRVLELRCKS